MEISTGVRRVSVIRLRSGGKCFLAMKEWKTRREGRCPDAPLVHVTTAFQAETVEKKPACRNRFSRRGVAETGMKRAVGGNTKCPPWQRCLKSDSIHLDVTIIGIQVDVGYESIHPFSEASRIE